MLAHVHQPERFVIRNIHFYVCYRMIKVHICFYPLDVIRENNYVTIWMLIKDMINTSIVVRFITMQKTTTNIITSSNMNTDGMWFIYFFKQLGTLYRNLCFHIEFLLNDSLIFLKILIGLPISIKIQFLPSCVFNIQRPII